jgi:hypothetical protein
MGFHAEVPLISLLGLMHVRIALALGILGGAGCIDQGGIDNGALFEVSPLAARCWLMVRNRVSVSVFFPADGGS